MLVLFFLVVINDYSVLHIVGRPATIKWYAISYVSTTGSHR